MRVEHGVYLQGQRRLERTDLRYVDVSIQNVPTCLDEQVGKMWHAGDKTLTQLLWLKDAGLTAPESCHCGECPPGVTIGRPSLRVIATTALIEWP